MPPDDDLTISDDDRLFRRVPPNLIVWNDNAGAPEVSSAAFFDSSDGTGMSVSVESVLRDEGLTERDVLRGYDGFVLVAIAARLVREQGQVIVKKPTDSDPAHAEVIGRKTRGTRRTFKRNALWIVAPSESSMDRKS